uniref:DUF5666 domain-containing protein n=1 Tax=uncultured Armatimonadetes bacterium TaxID=157466 RepID=A0A6J4HRE7_9BACT|nr:hypothetical protein AVDCRST_MAG63-871 [uncultured Armatimonadetes bacterium]
MKRIAAVVAAMLATIAVAASAPSAPPTPDKAAPLRPADGAWPRRTTIDELNRMVKKGDYHLVRQQKVAHRLEFRGTVRIVRGTPLIELPGGFWSAHLENVSTSDRPLKAGDTVTGRALVVDEAYAALFLWVYEWRRE